MQSIMVYIAIAQWIIGKMIVFSRDTWNQLNPNCVIFANVAILQVDSPMWCAQGYDILPKGITHYLTPLDTTKNTLRMQRQSSIPELARIRLNHNRVDWENDNQVTIDGFSISRIRKTSGITGKEYTVGFLHNGIRYERLSDCLKVLERKFCYYRGQWQIH